jgi:cytochrome c oxidase assembly protein subunit 15
MAQPVTQSRNAFYKPALAWFAAIGSAWVFVLVMLGAFTTTIGAGMVFLDWPLSNGSLNPRGWLSNLAMFAEHSHRLSAGMMSAITITIAVWLWLHEERSWLRKLAIFAVVLVFAQAVVGGLRVLLESRHVEMIDTSVGRLFAMLHACLAQIFVCTLVAISVACCRPWIERRGAFAPPNNSSFRRIGIVCCTLLVVQLAVAAIMRHSFAGLAIPTFPQSTPAGDWLPAVWNFRVAINFTHRVLAGVITVALWWLALKLCTDRTVPRGLSWASVGMISLLSLQIFLGATVIWSGRNPYLTTGHVIVGACTLAATFSITWVLHRDVIEGQKSIATSGGKKARATKLARA